MKTAMPQQQGNELPTSRCNKQRSVFTSVEPTS